MPPTRNRFRPWGWLLSLIYSCALGLLIFADIALLRDVQQPLPPAVNPPPHWESDFPARIAQVTDALAHLPISLPTPGEERQGAGALRWIQRRYDLTLPPPEGPDGITQLLDPIRKAAPGVTVQVKREAGGAQVHVGIDGLLTHTLMLHWLDHRPRAAIIIDDLGNDLLIARALVGIDAPLTLAIMPFRPFSKQVAELAKMFSREVLLQLPMEADSSGDIGAHDVLRVDADRDEILHRLDNSLAAVPYAVGANNHMGSRFTSDRERMRWVLERLKEKELFFIDSATTSQSVVCEVAATIPLACVARTVFLDDADEEAAIRVQLDALIKAARTRGDAIGIGHPRAATLAALQSGLANFAAAGIDIVPISTIVSAPAAAQR